MRTKLGLAACILTLLISAGCARTAGQTPQSVGSNEPTGVLMRAGASGVPEDSPSVEVLPKAPETPDASEKEAVYEMIEAEPAPEPEPALTLEEIRRIPFSDVPDEDPRADVIRYAAYKSYMQGDGGDRFDPDGYVTRAGLVAALYRMSGAGESNIRISFPDVDDGAWYADAVSWAAEKGIASGAQDGSFGPEKQVTREQLAVFLYRFASPDGDGQASEEILAEYQDGGDVLEYARVPMAWALENGVFAGTIADAVHRSFPVSRAQLAQALTALDANEPLAAQLTAQFSTERPESLSAGRHEEIQSQIDAVAAKYGAAGLQAAVIEGGRVTDAYACGWATKGVDRMTPDHKTRIASITKVGVGLAAMALYEDGVISLDESIGTYWGVTAKNPYYPDDPVTIRSLLTHTSSIPSLGDDASRTREAVQSRLQSGGFTRTKPGAVSSWNYNNYAYGVLGQTLEIASGQFLDEVMAEHFWDIMEIDAAFESGNVANQDMLCTVYQYGGVGRSLSAMKSNTRRYSPPGATGTYFSGGMTMSAIDLGKLTALLANDGCYEGLQLLKASTVEMMEARLEPQLPDGTYQALALRSQDDLYGRDILYYHTGSAYGVFNWMSYDPETGDGVVVLTSGASGVKDSRGIYAVCGEISQYIYDAIA